MAPGACREPSSTGITGVPATIINYHPVSSQKSWHRCAALCLGESPAQARLKCLDLRCSFEALVKAEYGGRDHLNFAAWNYAENVRREETGICGITHERALQNLVVAMYGHYGRSDVTRPRPVTELYLHTTAWKWLLNWVITTGPSGGDNLGKSCRTGSPLRRFWLGIIGLIM